VFHHALGLTEPVRAFAAAVRDAGHTVHTPDLFDGRTFHTIEDGMAHAQAIGFPLALAATVPASELFVSPGSEHCFAEHDEQAAAALRQRVLAFLG